MVFSKIVTGRSYMILIIVLALQVALGCGTSDTNSGKTDCVAPAGSTITVNPAEQPISGGALAADVLLDWSVVVKYPDGTPMPDACIRISGAFAVTSALPTNYALYQFLFYPSWISANAPVDSGFTAKTDDAGQYTFSTFLSAGTPTFFDTIYVVSGTNMGIAKIEVAQ